MTVEQLAYPIDICVFKMKIETPKQWVKSIKRTQPRFTCSELTIETLEQGVKYVQS